MCGENMAKNRPKCCQNCQNFGCSNLWKSIFMTVEKPGKLGGNFFLLLWGHPGCTHQLNGHLPGKPGLAHCPLDHLTYSTFSTWATEGLKAYVWKTKDNMAANSGVRLSACRCWYDLCIVEMAVLQSGAHTWWWWWWLVPNLCRNARIYVYLYSLAL